MNTIKIGDQCYVRDNSFSHNIKNELSHISNECLAGDMDTDPVLVTVKSLPFSKVFFFYDKTLTKEFILVEYDGEIFEVLNKLTLQFISAKEHRVIMNKFFHFHF